MGALFIERGEPETHLSPVQWSVEVDTAGALNPDAFHTSTMS